MTSPDPVTLEGLAARVAVIEARLGIDPAGPAVEPPTVPTGLRDTVLADQRIQLNWDNAGDADSWDVLDQLNLAQPLKETVTRPQSTRSPLKPGQQRAYAIQARNAAGVSAPSAALRLPPPSIPTPADGYPAEIFGTGWKLTLPINGAQEIKQPALATYTSKYCELTDDKTGVVFRAWHGGDTTSGSKNPRSELRETVDGNTEGYWQIDEGHHELHISGAVTRLTKVKPQVVVGQVHDQNDDLVVWRLEADQLWLTDGNNTHAYLVDSHYALGQPYDLRMVFDNGVGAFFYNGVELGFSKTYRGRVYFKAGLYLQSNPTTAPGESTSEYGEVVLRSVTVTHS